MSELSPQAKAFLKAHRDAGAPTAQDAKRVRSALRLAIYGSAVAGAAPIAARLGLLKAGLVSTLVGVVAVTTVAAVQAHLSPPAPARVNGAVRPAGAGPAARRVAERSAPGPAVGVGAATAAAVVPEVGATPKSELETAATPEPSATWKSGLGMTPTPSPARSATEVPHRPAAPPVLEAGPSTRAGSTAAPQTPALPLPLAPAVEVAPAPPPPTPPTPSRDEELRLLEEAQAALRRGDPTTALEVLARREEAFGETGQLAEEARAARLVALCVAGRREQALTERARFFEAHPTSLHRDRIERACGGAK